MTSGNSISRSLIRNISMSWPKSPQPPVRGDRRLGRVDIQFTH